MFKGFQRKEKKKKEREKKKASHERQRDSPLNIWGIYIVCVCLIIIN